VVVVLHKVYHFGEHTLIQWKLQTLRSLLSVENLNGLSFAHSSQLTQQLENVFSRRDHFLKNFLFKSCEEELQVFVAVLKPFGVVNIDCEVGLESR